MRLFVKITFIMLAVIVSDYGLYLKQHALEYRKVSRAIFLFLSLKAKSLYYNIFKPFEIENWGKKKWGEIGLEIETPKRVFSCNLVYSDV